MPLTLLPAVDVAAGRAVGLTRGASSEAQSTSGSALEVAMGWVGHGAEWIHLVDLDAAFGRGSNSALLADVTEQLSQLDVKVELAGGIHDDASLEGALRTTCERVSLSTAALADPDWCRRVIQEHGARVAVSLDVQSGGHASDSGDLRGLRLSARGGAGDFGDLESAVSLLDAAGCARYIVTDVGRDGMLNGPNLSLYEVIARATPAEVLTSGGVASLDDLRAIRSLAESAPNIEGAIVGKALYAEHFTLAEALAAV